MTYYGAEIMLDVGLYQLDQQVACQRYRQTRIIAKLSDRVAGFVNSVKTAFMPLAPVLA